MTYNPNTHHRQSIRLKHYDYSQNGAYFVTICAQDKKCIFGKTKDGKMIENNFGKIAHNELQKTSEIRKNVEINYFIVMPNHIHAIIVINNHVGAYCNTPLQNTSQKKFRSPSNNLGSIIRGYKSTVTKQINELRNTPCASVWQRNYHEHIIRNEKSWQMIHDYIIQNPETWKKDTFFVE